MTVDHEALLEKYMRHVRQCEGIDFVDYIDDAFGASKVEFTEAEKMALRTARVRISENVWAEHPVDVIAAMTPDADPQRVAEIRAYMDTPIQKE